MSINHTPNAVVQHDEFRIYMNGCLVLSRFDFLLDLFNGRKIFI